VAINTDGGSATPGEDYDDSPFAAGQVTFNPGESEKWLPLDPIDDGATYTILGRNYETDQIVDDDPADVVIQGLPEETEPSPNEIDPGGTLVINDDDDNGNGVPDNEESQVDPADDELEAVVLHIPSDPKDGTAVTLSINPDSASAFRVWNADGVQILGRVGGAGTPVTSVPIDPSKGSWQVVYIEAIAPAQTWLVLAADDAPTAARPSNSADQANANTRQPAEGDLSVSVEKVRQTLMQPNKITATLRAGDPNAATTYKYQIKRNTSDQWFDLGTSASNVFDWRPTVVGIFDIRVTATRAGKTYGPSASTLAIVGFPSYGEIIDALPAETTGFDLLHEFLLTEQFTVDDPQHRRRETAFWIVLDTSTGAYQLEGLQYGPPTGYGPGERPGFSPAPKPQDSILNPNPTDTPTYTVAFFHTHTPGAYNPNPRPVGPSREDDIFCNENNVVGIVYDYVAANQLGIPAGYPVGSPSQPYPSGPNVRRLE
jgi:hypothetical protein